MGEGRWRLLPPGNYAWPPRCYSCQAEPHRANTQTIGITTRLNAVSGEAAATADSGKSIFCHTASNHHPPIYSRALLRVLTPLKYKLIASRWGRCSQTWSDELGNYSAHYVDDFRCS